VPVLLEKGTRFEAQLTVAGLVYGASSLSVEEDRGRQRLVFPLAGLPDPTAAAEVTLALRRVSGELAVVVDCLRWYSRSEFLAGSVPLPLQAEAAFEIEWLNEPSPGSDPPSSQ
jgi:hypothetical protein